MIKTTVDRAARLRNRISDLQVLAAAAAAAVETVDWITLPPWNMHSLALFETNGTFKCSVRLLSALIRLKWVVLACCANCKEHGVKSN